MVFDPSIGRRTRWQRGQPSPNPGGRPRAAVLSAALRTKLGTPIAVQQKLMRHADIRTTMNIYGSVVTDEMEVASAKVAGLALRMTN